MENKITLWETRIAELEARIREQQAAGVSKKRLAHQRGELQAFYGTLRLLRQAAAGSQTGLQISR